MAFLLSNAGQMQSSKRQNTSTILTKFWWVLFEQSWELYVSYLSFNCFSWLVKWIYTGSQCTGKTNQERNPIAIMKLSTVLRSTGNEKWLKHASDLACRFCSYGVWLRCFYEIILRVGDVSISQIPSMLKVLQALQSRLALPSLLET